MCAILALLFNSTSTFSQSHFSRESISEFGKFGHFADSIIFVMH